MYVVCEWCGQPHETGEMHCKFCGAPLKVPENEMPVKEGTFKTCELASSTHVNYPGNVVMVGPNDIVIQRSVRDE